MLKKIKGSKLIISLRALLTRGGGCRFYNSMDIIGSEIKKYSYFEHFQLYFFSKLLEQILDDSKKKVFIDIGSNIGNHAIYFSKYFNRFYLFEPNPITKGILSANVWACKELNNKTEVHGYALSNTEGKTTFYSRKPSENDDLTNLGNSGLEKSFIGSEYDEIIVETVLGDNALKNKININEDVVIKIDAEGHEVHVFDGLINTVQEVRPIFWVEIGGNEIFDQIYLKLKKHSYVAFGIRAIGPKNLILRAISGFPYQLDAIDSMNSRVYADVFFVPNRYI